MIYKILPDEGYKLVPLYHIPPDKEDEFLEKNKDSGLYIKVDLNLVFPECVRYDILNNKVVPDEKCIHRKRVERKIKDLKSSVKNILKKYLVKMDWGAEYDECVSELNSTYNFLLKYKDKYPDCFNYVSSLHDTYEIIWFMEEKLEKEIQKTKTYDELQKYDVYKFVQEKVRPLLEKIYQIYQKCEKNNCCDIGLTVNL